MARAADHDAVGQRCLATLLPGKHVVHLAPRGCTAAPGAAAVAGGDRPPQPVGDHAGGSSDVQGLALAVEHDRHDRGVAAQHPQRLGAQRAAEVQTRGASPVLQILQAHEHVQVWAPSATGGHVAVVEHVPARVGERFGLPLRLRALVIGVDGTGLRVDHRGDRVEHRGVVEMPLQRATCPATEALQVHLVDRIRRAVVGLGSVLVQRVDQSAAPFQQLRGRVPVGVGRQLGLGTRPHRGRQPLRGRAGQHPRDHLDVPQTRCSRGELLRRRGQPRGQRGSIQPGAGADLFRCVYPAPRLGAIPAHQICDGRDRVVISPLGERSAPQQIGHHGYDDLIQPPCHTFADREHGEQIVRCRGRSARDGKLVDSLRQVVMCRDDRGAGHPSIIPNMCSNYGVYEGWAARWASTAAEAAARCSRK